jgi:hypothetical protein
MDVNIRIRLRFRYNRKIARFVALVLAHDMAMSALAYVSMK